MPEITVTAVQGGDEWVVPMDAAAVENETTDWVFDSAPRTMLTRIQTGEALRDLPIKTDDTGRYSVESYQAASDLAFARVHLAGRAYACGTERTENLTTDQIDALPPDVLTQYAFKARGGGVLKAKKPTPAATPATAN